MEIVNINKREQSDPLVDIRPNKKVKKDNYSDNDKTNFKSYLDLKLINNCQNLENQTYLLSKDEKTWIKIISIKETLSISEYISFIDHLKKNLYSSSLESNSHSNMISYCKSLKLKNRKKHILNKEQKEDEEEEEEKRRRYPNKKYNINDYNEIKDKFFYDMNLIKDISKPFQKYNINDYNHHFILTKNKNEYLTSKELYSNLIKEEHKEEPFNNIITVILCYGSRRCLKIKPIKKEDNQYFSIDYYIGHYDILILSPDFYKTHTFSTNARKSFISNNSSSNNSSNSNNNNSIDKCKNVFDETSFYLYFVSL